MRTDATLPDVFPQIWAAMTTDRLMSLLGALHPKPHGRSLSLTCPACGKAEAYIYEPKDGKGPKIHCNRRNNCSYDEPLWEYVKGLHGGDGKEALAALAGAAGVRLEGVRLEGGPPLSRGLTRRAPDRSRFAVAPPVAEAAVAVPDGLDAKQAAYCAALAGSAAEAFLSARGLTLAEAARMGFGFCAAWPHYRPDWPMEGRARLTYPLTDRQGYLVAIEGRALSEVKPKSLCDGPKGAGVFVPGVLSLDDLYLCEGPLDAACLAGLGVDAVAICGTTAPAWLLRALAFRRVWAAFDADEAGDGAARKAAQSLAGHGAAIRRLRPPQEGADWGDYLTRPLAGRRAAFWEARGVPDESVLMDLRARVARLFDYGTRLRCQDPPEGTRAQALRYQAQQIEKLAALAESAGLMIVGPDGADAGYADPSDPWADEVLVMLRADLAELSRADAPYPVPPPADGKGAA